MCVERVEDAGCVLNTGGNKNAGEAGKKGDIDSSYCNLVQNVRFVG
jgi:hypothetical protein